ncbi:protein MULTIPLE CHLOROPLAST DIVISION SITE 1 isoform X2 [Silene latifolia]|uniref:protein MULTIPLE CHLOROPLAST DIVISION SITE 1 isoform X2 n=1 Tax=Silene latifolia TaxID=37657 RepID=UPI003D777069
MASSCCFHLHSFSPQHCMFINGVGIQLGLQYTPLKLNQHKNHRKHLFFTACTTDDSTVRIQSSSDDSDLNSNNRFNLKKSMVEFQRIAKSLPPIVVVKSQDAFHQVVASLPPVVVVFKKQSGGNLIIGLCVAIACLVIAIRINVVRKQSNKRPGSVADLVRRGQLRSDRRGISKPLKYEDPFNNPLVKAGNGNSTVEMCGKVYRMAPVTLSEEQRAIHQKRRSRAYQWQRPKVFLKEGDPIPPDVDPESIRWIPANHPFATTASDIDEDFAQTNVYQTHGVPFRIQAEHEALQKKLEALQSEQKLNKLGIDPANAKDFERAFKTQSKSIDRGEGPNNGQVNDPKSPKADQSIESSDGNTASDPGPYMCLSILVLKQLNTLHRNV